MSERLLLTDDEEVKAEIRLYHFIDQVQKKKMHGYDIYKFLDYFLPGIATYLEKKHPEILQLDCYQFLTRFDQIFPDSETQKIFREHPREVVFAMVRILKNVNETTFNPDPSDKSEREEMENDIRLISERLRGLQSMREFIDVFQFPPARPSVLQKLLANFPSRKNIGLAIFMGFLGQIGSVLHEPASIREKIEETASTIECLNPPTPQDPKLNAYCENIFHGAKRRIKKLEQALPNYISCTLDFSPLVISKNEVVECEGTPSEKPLKEIQIELEQWVAIENEYCEGTKVICQEQEVFVMDGP